MATPYVSRNEFNDEQNALYARISRHSDARFDALGAQIQADRTEIIKRLDKSDARQDKMEKISVKLSHSKKLSWIHSERLLKTSENKS